MRSVDIRLESGYMQRGQNELWEEGTWEQI